jgi:hypothetical protein
MTTAFKILARPGRVAGLVALILTFLRGAQQVSQDENASE